MLVDQNCVIPNVAKDLLLAFRFMQERKQIPRCARDDNGVRPRPLRGSYAIRIIGWALAHHCHASDCDGFGAKSGGPGPTLRDQPSHFGSFFLTATFFSET